jgi:hypothetical protein
MMAGKARLLSEVIEKALTSDETNHEDSTLKDQMKAFKANSYSRHHAKRFCRRLRPNHFLRNVCGSFTRPNFTHFQQTRSR